MIAQGARPGIPGPGRVVRTMDRDGLVDRRLGSVMQEREGEDREGPQVLLEDSFLRGGAGRQQMPLTEAQGGNGDLETMVEQPAGISMVMRFGRRQFLRPGREPGQGGEIVPLEVSAGRAGQFLDTGDGFAAGAQKVPRGQDRKDAGRQSRRIGQERFRWDLRILATPQEFEEGPEGSSHNNRKKKWNLAVANRIAKRRIKAPKPPKSIGELVERYCREIVLRPASQEAYITVGRIFQRDTGIVSLSRVTRDVVIEWRHAVLDRTSIVTWNSYLGWMRNLFNLAVRRGWLAESPFREVRAIRAPTKRKTVPKNLLGEALDRLQSDPAPIRPGWFWAAAFKLLFYTGMRRRQLTTLRWWHIDFENGTILLVVEGSKTKLEWTIPIPLACLDDLLELRRRSEKSCTTNLAMAQVFRVQLFDENYAGSELTPSQVSGAFSRLSEQLSGRISPHRLRHTMATELAQGRNPDLRSLQYILGHQSIATTMGYVQPEIVQVRLQLRADNLVL
jgi:integrase